jgi:hypothetical protein
MPPKVLSYITHSINQTLDMGPFLYIIVNDLFHGSSIELLMCHLKDSPLPLFLPIV